METTAQENRPIRHTNYFVTVVAVIIAFIAGIFVGLHPSWIPLHTNGTIAPDMPSMTPTPGTDTTTEIRDRDQPTTMPTAQPTSEPTTMP